MGNIYASHTDIIYKLILQSNLWWVVKAEIFWNDIYEQILMLR